ncbi:hypothetical protein KCU90_g170, partial [Aureobasidium melanogenum]
MVSEREFMLENMLRDLIGRGQIGQSQMLKYCLLRNMVSSDNKTLFHPEQLLVDLNKPNPLWMHTMRY